MAAANRDRKRASGDRADDALDQPDLHPADDGDTGGEGQFAGSGRGSGGDIRDHAGVWVDRIIFIYEQ